MLNIKVILSVIGAGLLLGGLFLVAPFEGGKPQSHAQLIQSAKPQGGDFTLQSANGEKSLHDFQGKLVMLYFGYTYCPDICPTNLSNLASAYHTLNPEQQKNTQILFVSVDPERDTVSRLAEYVQYFNADIIGLSGDMQSLTKMARNYGVVFNKVIDNNAANYAVDHTAYTYMIDAQGRLLDQLPHGTAPQQFQQAMVNQLTKQMASAD